MPIEWSDAELQQFFGSAAWPKTFEPDQPQVCLIQYNGPLLKYHLMLHLADEIAMISGDTEYPFGANSMYEISVPCDSITQIEDGYYPGKTGLGFWYGDPTKKYNMTMMLLMRPDGDLKVWPGCVWPERHAYNKMPLKDFDGKRYDPVH